MFQIWGRSKRDGTSPYRMHRYGHVAELVCPADTFPCPICGELQVWCTLPKGPRGDYMPAADLTWPGVTLISSFGLRRFIDAVRCEGCIFVWLDDLCTVFRCQVLEHDHPIIPELSDLPRRGLVQNFCEAMQPAWVMDGPLVRTRLSLGSAG